MGSVHDPPDLSEPPGPPELPRRVRMYPGQWIGIPLLFLLPVLALFGIFGDTRAHAESVNSELELTVEYSDRLRRGQRSDVLVQVRNLTDQALDSVTVRVDPEYLAHFTNVSFTPQPLFAYDVALLGLRPGETRRVRIEMEGESAWRTRGRITASSGAADPAAVDIGTFVFP